jgi:hypothetical protein
MPFTPYDAATNGLDRATELLGGARLLGPSVRRDPDGTLHRRRAQLKTQVRADMRRLSLVMAIAALDTYMHRLVVERAYTHKELPGALAKLEVSFERLLQEADGSAAAARAVPHKSRPRVAVKRELRDRLLRETFQNYDNVAKALGMAGVKKPWSAIASSMSPPMKTEDIKRRLNGIVMRRNQIVHEGDYERLDRPRGPNQNELTHAEAAADITFIRALVEAINRVA